MSLLNNPDYMVDLNGAMSSRAIGAKWSIAYSAVNKQRRKYGYSKPDKPTVAPAGKASLEMNVATGDGEFTNIPSDAPLTNWDHIFEQFNLDPQEFAIVDDTVRMATWQQSKGLDDGTRDIVNLYSYRARFTRKVDGKSLFDVADLVAQARRWTIPATPAPVCGTPVAAVLNIADMQLFQSEGGGHKATLNRLRLALHHFRDHITTARKTGMNINELVIVNNGDPFEGIAGNYANQLHTVEGGLRAQMNGVLDVWLMFARELYPLFEKRQFVSVLCNHTQFGRQGGSKDSITGDEDNGGAFLAETLKRVLDVTPGLGNVQFTIPTDEMNVFTEAAGVQLGFNHGHKIPKSDASGFETWLNGQVRHDPRAYKVRLWVTAHRHNLQMFDIGSASVLQCPSCGGGSKWLTDRTGTHSNAGLVSILVGNHHRLGWTDLQFL